MVNPLVRWEPFRDIERLFDEWPMPRVQSIGWDLAVDVFEEEGNIVAEMTLPGIDPEKVDISIEDDYLRISGNREDKKEVADKNYYSKEIRRGSFERVVKLPSKVEADKAQAEYRNGVLRVTISKEETKSNKIKVNIK